MILETLRSIPNASHDAQYDIKPTRYDATSLQCETATEFINWLLQIHFDTAKKETNKNPKN